ncbi:AAA family ATPase [Novosphingobium sp. Chol11]|uniref:AAA family ATPase n=1 Tax=Novosphingobium sp. Chol11 TaxID=1385763 RepID=UPI000BE3EA70|nr:AAA family ATPase [Novosphingobium sp. Chol11]
MHTIKSIEVLGFRGQSKPIYIELSRDANFIIGRNGAGKTTLIHLINAVLANDIAALSRGKFKSVTIKFQRDDDRKVPSVRVERLDESVGGGINYYIKDSSRADEHEYPVLRREVRRIRIGPSGRIVNSVRDVPPVANSSGVPLTERLKSLYNFTWLSLQRRQESEVDDEFDTVDEYSNDVDRKLNQVFNDLVRYFSRLDRRVSDETQNFQKKWFLSFLSSERKFDPSSISKLDIESEKNSLASIFEKFEMEKRTYEKNLENHFD